MEVTQSAPKETNFVRKLWSFMHRYRGSLYLAILFVAINAILSVLEPFILGLIITEITENILAIARDIPGASINYPKITWLLVIYFIRSVVVQVALYSQNFFITNAVQSTVQDIRKALSHKLNQLPVSYVDRHQFGDLLGRLTNDVEAVSNAMQQSLLQVVEAILKLTFVVAFMLYLNVTLAIILTVTIPLCYFVANYLVKKSQPYFNKQQNILGDLNGYIQENFSGFTVVKLYSREAAASHEFRQITKELAEVGFKSSFISALMLPLVGVISHGSYLVVAFVGSLQVIAGTLTIGNLQAFSEYVWQINQPIQILTQLSGMIQTAKAATDRIFEVLEGPEEVDEATIKLEKPLTGQVTFDQVSFSYTPEQELIRDFTVDVKPGEMVAIVGPTGAGKTTMINLLMRFYDVDEGAIRVDGMDVRDLSRQEYRQNFGMVLQDTWLFEGTVKENLRFGNLEATDEEIVEAAKAANVDHFIRTLPGGYNMMMNQESSNISQGQKQLFTIARALLSDPKILILDEATSSVDTRLELLIQKAMNRLMEGRTSFVIAHRLSTIQEADKIIVMKDGQIIEIGDHESLLEKEGFYANLYHSQFEE